MRSLTPAATRRRTAFANRRRTLAGEAFTSSTASFTLARAGTRPGTRARTHRAGSRRERGVHCCHRTAAEPLDRVVERAHHLDRAVRDPLREGPVARVETGVSSERGRRDRRRRPPRRPAGRPGTRPLAPSAQPAAGTRRPSCGAFLPAARRGARRPPATRSESCRASRARHTVSGRPSTTPRAPMCGRARARGSRAPPAGRAQSSSRSAGPIFSAYVAPSSGCGVKPGSGRTSSRRSSATAADRSYTAPASSSGSMANARCAATGPASSSAVVRWIVTPVSRSPAMIARSTGAAPRQRGRRDGWTFSQRRSPRSADGMRAP